MEISQVWDRDCAGRMFQAGEKLPAMCQVLAVDENLQGQAVSVIKRGLTLGFSQASGEAASPGLRDTEGRGYKAGMLLTSQSNAALENSASSCFSFFSDVPYPFPPAPLS